MRLAGIGVPSDAAVWEAVGFTVADGQIAVANGALMLGGAGLSVAPRPEQTGVFGCDGGEGTLEGIRLDFGEPPPPCRHTNGAFELDHLVLLTDSLERTSEAVHGTLGLECRRIRETPTVRQAFHRFDDPGDTVGTRGCIIEVVERPGQTATVLMGVVFNVRDLASVADQYGDEVMSRPKDAVQTGRRIAAFRREAALRVPVALMTPP